MRRVRTGLTVILVLCGLVVAAAWAAGLHPALDTAGVWLVYATAGAALCAAAYATMRAGRGAVIAAIVAAAGIAQLWPHFGSGMSGGDLRLRQHNLLYTNEASGLAERIADADVVTFQEVEAAVPTVRDLPAEWDVQLCDNLGVGAPAIATRLPVIERGCFRGGAWERVETAAGATTFVSLHLHLPWPWPQPEQMERILDDLAALPRPVVIGGDFNQGAWSHAVAEIAAATGTRAVPGIDVTHTRRGGLIRLPIDHVLLPEGWSGAAVPGERYGSDHRTVLAEIALP